EAFALVGARNAELDTGGFQSFAVDRAFHQVTGAEHRDALKLAALRLFGNFSGDVQPGPRRTVLVEVKGLMDSVVGTDKKVRASAGEVFRRGEHQFGHTHPIVR